MQPVSFVAAGSASLARSLPNNTLTTGFFSVGVLETALETWELTLMRWRSEAMRPYHDKPEEQLGFVLNFRSHWFCIRSFSGGYWFNLNSFLAEPAWVGPSYLGALLEAVSSPSQSLLSCTLTLAHCSRLKRKATQSFACCSKTELVPTY